jgi:retron-type reverse transcriptase
MIRWKRALGLAPGVRRLAQRLGVSEESLQAARPLYREIRIPKKRGGHRVLHVPDDATKALQRRILHRLLARMKSHPCAFGFERGRSIAHNAAQHTGRALVLRFDVVDFFPTTRAGRIERMFLRFGWSAEAAALLTRLVTHGDGLPQGAPTSPRLSNLVNAGLDRELDGLIGRRQGRYTRYADDITVSFPENWIGEPERTGAVVRYALALRGYRMHGKEKTSVRRRHQRQVVTGLVVNRKVALSRPLRRRLRAARHHLATGRPVTFTPEQLQGWTAFENMVRRQGADTPPPWVRTRKPGRSGRWRP